MDETRSDHGEEGDEGDQRDHGDLMDLAARLRAALSTHDLAALGELMAFNVTWGDVDDPRGCRTRDDVLATFARLRDQGVSGDISEMLTGTRGIVVVLQVRWPAEHPGAGRLIVYQLYVVREGRVVEIRGFETRAGALAALDGPA